MALTSSFMSGCASDGSPVTGPFLQPGTDTDAEAMRWSPVENMSDEFDGDTVDASKWQTEPFQNGWVWIGRPPGLFKAENITVADGSLNVTVSGLPETVVKNGRTYDYQGGIVRSLHAGQPGWYYETRMKANATVMSSTFWLMTSNRSGSKKKLELDIQECVGLTTDLTFDWARTWDQIYHSNMIHRVNEHNPEPVQHQKSVPTPTKNHERYYVYAAWWKSPEEVRFYLDGAYVYSITPPITWDVPAFLQMAIETYDWNPVPDDGGLITTGTLDQRTTRYDWVRVWKPEG
ncbi:MAG: glycosyl hydrolase [Planctomycetota bacterium]